LIKNKDELSLKTFLFPNYVGTTLHKDSVDKVMIILRVDLISNQLNLISLHRYLIKNSFKFPRCLINAYVNL